MATRAKAAPAADNKDLVVARALTSEELTALLKQSGWAETPSQPRLSFQGNQITTPDGDMFVYNPKRPDIPALTVRIVKPPETYRAIWLTQENADKMGRPEIGNSFSKKFDHPDQARNVEPSDAAFEEIKTFPGLTDNFGKALKPSWKGDILVQIVPEDGTLTGNETIYILSLPTTSLMEFLGSFGGDAGVVSDYNFIRKLSMFAMEEALKAGNDPAKAVIDALTSLTLGGVVADIRILPASNKEKNQTWSVIVFDPIHIEAMQQGDALLPAGDLTEDPDEVGI